MEAVGGCGIVCVCVCVCVWCDGSVRSLFIKNTSPYFSVKQLMKTMVSVMRATATLAGLLAFLPGHLED